MAEDFKETILLEFEGSQYCAIKGYDRFLRTVYGDYMQLPPEEQRVPAHDLSGYFWR